MNEWIKMGILNGKIKEEGHIADENYCYADEGAIWFN